MTRKLALTVALLGLFGFLFGAAWRHLEIAPYTTIYHHYSQARDWVLDRQPEGTPEDLVARQQAEIDRLRSLGYLNARSPALASGVTIHDRDRVCAGLNLSTEGNRAEATLRDMDGNEIHRWHLSFAEAYPDKSRWPTKPPVCWRRVHLLPDGSLLAVFAGHSLLKVDRDSKLLWAYTGGTHHDFEVQPDGSIYCLTRTAELVESFNADQPILHDYVVRLDSSGKELRRISILQAILNSPYKSILHRGPKQGDILHTNTIEVLDGSLADRAPAFAAGRILLSIPMLDAVVVLDPETERIVWALKGYWIFQHQPTVVEGKNLLVFDNQGDSGRSRVIEIDPATLQVVWSYTNEHGSLASKTLGSNQRLPNGNTLITESNMGRVIEVTPDHEVVWEYHSPHRSGKLVTQVFDLVRLPPDFPIDWAD